MTTFYWKNFECEICKTPYPYFFKAGGHKYSLVEITKPPGNYIVLEALNLEKNTTRMIHIMSANYRGEFRIGRGHDSDLRINDISVSRCHEILKYKNNHFYISDNVSKFGTHILIRKKLLIAPNTYQAVQIGRSLINFGIKKCKPKVYRCGEYIKQKQVAKEYNQQEEELKKIFFNMKNTEDYLQK